MSEHQRYPMAMSHPAFRPGIVDGDGSGRSAGQPVRFPPVMVEDEDQEEQYAAKGYKPNGISDPDAFNRLTQAPKGPVQEPRAFQEWPKWIEGVEYRDEAHWRSETGQPPAEVVAAPLSEDALAVKASFETGLADLQVQLAEAMAEIERLKKPKPQPHAHKNRGRPRKAA